ncbi:MAG: cytochrome c3 family protein [Spirochaetota bacterium]|nr:cytochrome c3 family protein [Spirochaetota bacterium]
MRRINIIKCEKNEMIHSTITKAFLSLVFCITIFIGCTESLPDGLIEDHYHSEIEWMSDNPQHDDMFVLNSENCMACHGDDLNGGQSGVSCVSCHHDWGAPENPQHGSGFIENPSTCMGCHGQDLEGGLVEAACFSCHHGAGSDNWMEEHGSESISSLNTCNGCHNSEINDNSAVISCTECHHDWNGPHNEAFNENPESCKGCHGGSIESCADCHHAGWTGSHGDAYAGDPNNCKECHGEDLNGKGDQDRDCGICHHEEAGGGWQHGASHTLPNDCAGCHGEDFTGSNTLVSCFSCHSDISAFNCSDCHNDIAGYTTSAHGNTDDYGINRSSTGYDRGDCLHCHDLAADPANEFMLFAPMNGSSQTENFCFHCHRDTGDSPVQAGMVKQYSYSYRAGGWTDDTVDDVKEAFSNTSSHNLNDILTFITGKWGFTADSNPCDACHNPHAAQRDPHADGVRGWPMTLPSNHGSSVVGEILWGDDAGERMSGYTDYYQAPYLFGGGDYEPDGSGTTDGSNLTDYATLCQDCHVTDMSVPPYNLLNTPIDWATSGGESGGDKHGINPATNSMAADLLEPYQSRPWTASGLVLSCTDCHEPHGSSSDMLIRGEVNGAVVGPITIGSPKDLQPLCQKCHQQSLWSIHHSNGGLDDAPYDTSPCNNSNCHNTDTGNTNIPCSKCHFHGGDDSWLIDPSSGVVNGSNYVTGRRTF